MPERPLEAVTPTKAPTPLELQACTYIRHFRNLHFPLLFTDDPNRTEEELILSAARTQIARLTHTDMKDFEVAADSHGMYLGQMWLEQERLNQRGQIATAAPGCVAATHEDHQNP